MKNLANMISILALAAIAGCAKVEVDVVPASQKQEEISFTVANRSAQTKAGFETNRTFAVYGLYTGAYSFDEIDFTDAVTYMNAVSISFVDNTWKNSSKSYYWPKNGKLSFIAFWPASAGLQLGDSNSNVLTYKNYNVTESYADQTAEQDLLVSSVNKDLTASSNAVALTFRHTLSQVKFTAKTVAASNGLTYHVTLNNVAISNIYDEADYSFDSTTDKSVWTINTAKGLTASGDIYNPGNTLQTVGKTYATPKAELSTSASALGTDKKAYYVMPQELGASAVISVSYTIYTCNAAGTILDVLNIENESIRLNTLGTTAAITAWESGKSYTYNITINPVSTDVITFDPSVANWTSADNTVVL